MKLVSLPLFLLSEVSGAGFSRGDSSQYFCLFLKCPICGPREGPGVGSCLFLFPGGGRGGGGGGGGLTDKLEQNGKSQWCAPGGGGGGNT